MSLQGDLEPKLAQIRTAADEAYHRYLADIPDKEFEPDVWIKDAQEFWGTVDALFNRFRRYYVLDAHDFGPDAATLARPGDDARMPSAGTVFDNICSGDVNFVRPVRDLIDADEWKGPAATAFRLDFIDPFDTAADWQAAYAKELAICVGTYAEAVKKIKDGAIFVADGCLGALRGHPIYSQTPGTWQDAANLVSLLATVAGLFTGGGVALVLGGISLVTGLSTSIHGAGDEVSLVVDDNPYPQGILRNTGYALDNLDKAIADLDSALAKGLNKDLGGDGLFTNSKLRLPPPGLKPSAYSQPTFKAADNDQPDIVVKSFVKLFKAGYFNLPGAAQEYDQALQRVQACQIPGSAFGQLFPRSVGPYNMAIGDLADILGETRDSLTEAGDAILTAARQLQGTDEENAQIIRYTNLIAPPHSTAPFHDTEPLPDWLR